MEQVISTPLQQLAFKLWVCLQTFFEFATQESKRQHRLAHLLGITPLPSLPRYSFTTTMTFIADVMAPGGGVLLLPFVRVVISILLVCCVGTFIAGVARIHMAILSFLSGGLLVSLHMFEKAFNNLQNKNNQAPPAADNTNKTD